MAETAIAEKDLIPTIRKNQWNIYKPSDIKRWGSKPFFETVAPQKDYKWPHFEFSDEENRRMDELLSEEKVSEP